MGYKLLVVIGCWRTSSERELLLATSRRYRSIRSHKKEGHMEPYSDVSVLVCINYDIVTGDVAPGKLRAQLCLLCFLFFVFNIYAGIWEVEKFPWQRSVRACCTSWLPLCLVLFLESLHSSQFLLGFPGSCYGSCPRLPAASVHATRDQSRFGGRELIFVLVTVLTN